MPSEFVLPAPAKLNLFLHIIGRRPDGYHNLQTLFQFLDYGDQLTFTAIDDGVELVTDLAGVAAEDNLIMKAVRLLLQVSGCRSGVRIALDKRLPMGAGLGGGSSNAATTLLGLNALWGLGLGMDQLAGLGLQLGADVPVFVRGYSAFAEGVGDALTPLEPPEEWFLVAVPDVHVSTAAMYGHRDLTRDSLPITLGAALDLSFAKHQQRRNDFQSLVCTQHPQVDKTLRVLDNFAGLSIGRALMSGSGASVFVRFANHEQALTAQSELGVHISRNDVPEKVSGLYSFVARGVNTSPLHWTLQSLGFALPA